MDVPRKNHSLQPRNVDAWKRDPFLPFCFKLRTFYPCSHPPLGTISININNRLVSAATATHRRPMLKSSWRPANLQSQTPLETPPLSPSNWSSRTKSNPLTSTWLPRTVQWWRRLSQRSLLYYNKRVCWVIFKKTGAMQRVSVKTQRWI